MFPNVSSQNVGPYHVKVYFILSYLYFSNFSNVPKIGKKNTNAMVVELKETAKFGWTIVAADCAAYTNAWPQEWIGRLLVLVKTFCPENKYI
jgi:hypothetical protein